MLENSCTWTIITILTITLEWIVLNEIIMHSSIIRVSKLNRNSTLFLVILFMIFMNLVEIPPDYRIIIGICATFIFYKYTCDENIVKTIIVSLIYWMILLGIDTLSMSLVVWINSLHEISQLIGFNLYRLQAICISKGVLIVISICYCKLKINVEISNKDIAYILVPIITNIASFFALYRYVIKIEDIYIVNDKELVIISFLLFLSSICLVLAIRKIIIDNKLIAEGNFIKEKMKMQYDHYINVQQDHMKVRQLHHDIKNHIACIKGVIKSNNAASDYITNIENELDRYDNTFNTENMVLDIILHEKSKVCKKCNIKLLIDIKNFDTCNFIDVIDICSIFSNILDNAIEACEKISYSKKEITLRGARVKNFFIIRIENTKQNKVYTKDNYIKTDKKNTDLHGIGIKSVKDSVSKYNGDVAIEYSENKFIMKIFIPLIPK